MIPSTSTSSIPTRVWKASDARIEHFAAALSDQTDNVDVGVGIARYHADERRFSDAASGKYSEPLPLADGEHRVDRTHSGRYTAHDGKTLHRIGRRCDCGIIGFRHDFAEPVAGFSRRIDDAPQKR